jgi:hypothetical protein
MSDTKVRLPKIVGSREIVFNGTKTRDLNEGEVPVEVENYAKSVIGDGQARVAVSADMSVKDFGNGCSASVTLSISCNQDDQTINHVVQALGNWTKAYARQQFLEVDKEYQQMKAQKDSFKP